MKVATFEGIVEQGQIRLNPKVRLPEKAKVYVVIPGFQAENVVHVFTPRLVHPEQARDFRLEVAEAHPDASL